MPIVPFCFCCIYSFRSMFFYCLDSLKVTVLILAPYQVINPASSSQLKDTKSSKLKCSICISEIIYMPLIMYTQKCFKTLFKLFIISFQLFCEFLTVICFICYLSAPRASLGHYWGDSFTHSMLITALFSFTKGHLDLRNEVGPLRLADYLVGIEPGTLDSITKS